MASSTRTSLLDLGQDILEILAEKVYEDRTYDYEGKDRNVRILSLVSRAFRMPCQRLLFRNIHLRNGEYPLTTPLPSLLRLHSVLSKNIHLSSYIRILKIRQTFAGGFEDDFLPWVELDPLLFEVLNLFASSPITTLRLSSDYEALYWAEMDGQLQNSFMAIFSKPTFQSLELSRVVVPPWLLSPTNLPHLENLYLTVPQLYDTQDENNNSLGAVKDKRVLSNVYIEFEGEGDWDEDWDQTPLHILALSSGLDFRTVRCLGIEFAPGIVPGLGPVVPLLLQLADLRISLYGCGQDLSDQLVLSSLVSLQNLTICHQFQNSLESSFCWTLKALASIPSAHSSLRSISVGLRFEFDDESKERQGLIGRLSDELQRLHKRPASATIPGGFKTELHFRSHPWSMFGHEAVFGELKEVIESYFRWGKEDGDATGSGKFAMDLLKETHDHWVYTDSKLRSIMSL
ncbi:hypothetical protein BDN72DRAFT_844485 [Pluteus cervinus]|uniref:Uncharacterized protein n=1 Tax=Pluteus cervinus TaxID=181527 RepID=A0ACD3AKA9_9AGAR|nr:hypothetical protein BDN72DRAFT_844485 [Pluteus cervinus]